MKMIKFSKTTIRNKLQKFFGGRYKVVKTRIAYVDYEGNELDDVSLLERQDRVNWNSFVGFFASIAFWETIFLVKILSNNGTIEQWWSTFPGVALVAGFLGILVGDALTRPLIKKTRVRVDD